MQNKKSNTLIVFLVVGALALASCSRSTTTDKSTVVPANAFAIRVTANAGLTPWIDRAADKFNKSGAKLSSGKTAFVEVNTVEAGQAVSDMTGGQGLPALWIPDDAVWTGVLAKRGQTGFQANCTSVAQSPLVIAMWRPIAEALGWPGRALGWLDIGTLAADPSSWSYYSGGKYGPALRVGHTHPGLSGSGVSTLLAVVQAARSKVDPVSVADINDPIAQASVKAFESIVASFSPATDKMGQTLYQRGIEFMGAGVEYESTLINNGGGGDSGLVAIYPFEGTFVAKHPACVNDGADAQTQETAKLFRDYLLKADAQQMAVAAGLRPATAAVATAGVSLGAPFDADHGVDPTRPKVVFGAPSVDTLLAVSNLWQSARKNVNLVMLIDVSGSMRGAKIDNVRTAAMQFVQQMGDNDFLTLMTFSDKLSLFIDHKKVSEVRDNAVNQIKGIQASGNTSLYDAIGTAAGLIKKSTSSQTSNVMVVLTDGQDTSSSKFGMNQSLVDTAAANNTTVFTIAYGDDADQDVMMKLASQGKGNFYAGNAANIASIYQEMSAAFGGSVGIGR
jgi:Ca-activated chloride channel family protein